MATNAIHPSTGCVRFGAECNIQPPLIESNCMLAYDGHLLNLAKGRNCAPSIELSNQTEAKWKQVRKWVWGRDAHLVTIPRPFL